jgi:formate--tetrahydrofolate ligase
MMSLDPTKLKGWQLAEAAEMSSKPLDQLGSELGLRAEELIPAGRGLAKVDHRAVMERLEGSTRGRYIDVTAITPTPLGEGKTTTTIGLVQGLARIGCRVAGAIRQPSGGPTFNLKGSGAGGGLSQCIPLAPLSVRLTGDLDSITNAHNLAMVALTARMQHERNYDDRRLESLGLSRLDLDPDRVEMKWAIDFCAQSLRRINIGNGGKMDGYPMESGFQITASSELMAILAVSRNLSDLRDRIGKIVVAWDRRGREVTTADLEVDGAMTAWMTDAVHPNLLQTIEGQPMLVHAGPFANIALGQSSVIADRMGTLLTDYLVTESGFGSDIGYEKFWNLKCRYSGLRPDAVVLVATIRALKSHGGGPRVRPGQPLDPAYIEENLELVERGCSNLLAHIDIVRKSGIQPVVCVNRFVTDSDEEIAVVKRIAGAAGAPFAMSDHWLKGGEGAVELAEAVVAACERPSRLRFLYDDAVPQRERIERITTEVYGGAGVSYQPQALAKLKEVEQDPELAALGTCMVKTQLSLSHDPALKGRPTGWTLPIRDLLLYRGAGLAVPVAGDIKLLPGTASDPAFRRIDVDTRTGRVQGLH